MKPAVHNRLLSIARACACANACLLQLWSAAAMVFRERERERERESQRKVRWPWLRASRRDPPPAHASRPAAWQTSHERLEEERLGLPRGRGSGGLGAIALCARQNQMALCEIRGLWRRPGDSRPRRGRGQAHRHAELQRELHVLWQRQPRTVAACRSSTRGTRRALRRACDWASASASASPPQAHFSEYTPRAASTLRHATALRRGGGRRVTPGGSR